MGRITAHARVTRFTSGESVRTRPDMLVVEEPLEIRVGGKPLAVTMRTPGHDIELVHGFLATESVVSTLADVGAARYCAGAVVDTEDGSTANTYNVIDVTLAPGVAPPDASVDRNFYTTSSCGICGKASIEAVRQQARWDVATDPVRLDPELMLELPERLRSAQRTFERTGGLHAAGLFTADGERLVVREDVGRHNAVDKVVGWALLQDLLPARGCVLVVSGRASFELTQKALLAGIPAMVAVSAPSSLAVEFAQEAGMTLLGFVRRPTMNAYSRPDRLTG